jgi:hypothetical protein
MLYEPFVGIVFDGFDRCTPGSDALKERLDVFLAGNDEDYEGVSKMAKECEIEGARLTKYYGCDKSMSVEEVVSTFRTFVRACKGVGVAIDTEAAVASSSMVVVPAAAAAVSRQLKQKIPAKQPNTAPQPEITIATQPVTSSSIDVFEIPDCDAPFPFVKAPPLHSNQIDSNSNQLSLKSNLPPPPPPPDLFAAQTSLAPNAFVVSAIENNIQFNLLF